METIYYNLDARRLTVYDMASGEAAPAPRDMLFLRTQPRVPQREGKVLDFDACRRALTGEETPFDLPEDAAEEVREDNPGEDRTVSAVEQPRQRRPRRFHLALDAAASLAVVVMAAVVVSQFLRLF